MKKNETKDILVYSVYSICFVIILLGSIFASHKIKWEKEKLMYQKTISQFRENATENTYWQEIEKKQLLYQIENEKKYYNNIIAELKTKYESVKISFADCSEWEMVVINFLNFLKQDNLEASKRFVYADWEFFDKDNQYYSDYLSENNLYSFSQGNIRDVWSCNCFNGKTVFVNIDDVVMEFNLEFIDNNWWIIFDNFIYRGWTISIPINMCCYINDYIPQGKNIWYVDKNGIDIFYMLNVPNQNINIFVDCYDKQYQFSMFPTEEDLVITEVFLEDNATIVDEED